MPGDPRDSTTVAQTLADWATGHFGGPVTVHGAPTTIGGGLDSYLHSIALHGAALPAEWHGPLVVRLLPATDRDEQAAREVAVQRWCAQRAFAVPTVVAVFAAGELFHLPTQVMQRVPGLPMLAAITKAPWRAGRLVDLLAATAHRLHGLPTDGWPGPSQPTATVDQRLGLPRRAVESLGLPELSAALARAETVAPLAVGSERVVCHGDFHPLNVMVDGDAATVLDWTDATLGPREADVSRTLLLFHVASIAANGAAERAALRVVGPWLERRYRRAYLAHAELDPVLLQRWEVLHLVHGWAQVEMLRAGAFAEESSAAGSQLPDAVPTFLRARFELAAAAVGA